MTHKPTNSKRRGRPSRTSATPPCGYAEAARRLGVTTSHLWQVLNADRQSPPLMARYRALFN